MNAGQELDALVAEKVMGWRSYRTCHASYGGSLWSWNWYASSIAPPHCDGYFDGEHTPQTYPRPVAPGDWSPSSSIADAWEVMEKLRADFVSVDLVTAFPGWNCSILRGVNDEVDATGATAPLAICLVAMKATEDTFLVSGGK